MVVSDYGAVGRVGAIGSVAAADLVGKWVGTVDFGSVECCTLSSLFDIVFLSVTFSFSFSFRAVPLVCSQVLTPVVGHVLRRAQSAQRQRSARQPCHRVQREGLLAVGRGGGKHRGRGRRRGRGCAWEGHDRLGRG